LAWGVEVVVLFDSRTRQRSRSRVRFFVLSLNITLYRSYSTFRIGSLEQLSELEKAMSILIPTEDG